MVAVLKNTRDDLPLFVDYAIRLLRTGRIEVENLNDNSTRSFDDITAAVDHAAAHSLTVSPRLPKGYRSKIVQLMDQFAGEGGLPAAAFRESENVIIDFVEIDEPEEQESELECLRRIAREYLRNAIESNSKADRECWIERSNDLFAAADCREARFSEHRDSEESPRTRDPYRHVQGRSLSTTRG